MIWHDPLIIVGLLMAASLAAVWLLEQLEK
jgi:hypothetical protein